MNGRKTLEIKQRTHKWFFLFLLIAGLATACANYDDDISNLQKQIDVNTSSINGLLALVQEGKFVQKVETTSTGIKITFSDGTTAAINNGTNGTNGTNGANGANGTDGTDGANGTNGINGANGSVITLGSDGYWYIDGVKTSVLAAGTKGAAGASSIVTIGADGYWYIDGVKTTTKATGATGATGETGETGTAGATGATGNDGITPIVGTDGYWYIGTTRAKDANGSDIKAAGSVVTIGSNGYWYIDGVNTNVRATGGVTALLENGYYTITIFNADGTTQSVSIPGASATVTSMFFYPEYINSNGVALIYVPYIEVGTTKLWSNPSISYRVNPFSVDESNFTIEGLDKSNLTTVAVSKKSLISMAPSANAYISVSKSSYAAGRLNVSVNGQDLGLDLDGAYSAYSLVLKNKDSAKYVYSNYVVGKADKITADKITIGKGSETSYADYAAGTPAVLADYGFPYKDSIIISPLAYFSASTSHLELSKFFNISLTFSSGSNTSKFGVVAQGSNSVKVYLKDKTSTNIGEYTKITATLKIGSVVVKTVDFTVAAKDANTSKTNSVFASGIYDPIYLPNADSLITSFNPSVANQLFGISTADFIDATKVLVKDSIYLLNGQTYSYITPALNPEIYANLHFTGTTSTANYLHITPAYTGADAKYIEPGTYKISRTYLYNVNNSQLKAEYVLTVKPSFTITKLANFWDSADNLVVYGHQGSTVWVMNGNLTDGIRKIEDHTSLELLSVIFERANATQTDVDLSGTTTTLVGRSITYTNSTITLANDSTAAANHITKAEKVPVNIKFKVRAANGNVYYVKGSIEQFNTLFKSPIKISAIDGGISFFEKENVTSRSPFEGLKITNLYGTIVDTKSEINKFGVVLQSNLVDPNETTRRLTLDWMANPSSAYGYGHISWSASGVNEGTTLLTPLTTEWTVTATTAWSQTITVSSNLKVTIKPSVINAVKRK